MNANTQPPEQVNQRRLLLALCGASFLAMLDLFVVNVAFPDIRATFERASLADLSWILNVYAIQYAALLIPLGRWADKVGRRRGFLLGLLIFIAGSAGCAVSSNLWWLVCCRALQATGAALLTPTSLALILTVIPLARRAGAIQMWAATGALAAAAGPVLGGVLVELSWRWVFAINIPVGLMTFWVAARNIPESRDSNATQSDVIGAFLWAIATGALALGLVKGEAWHWSSLPVVCCAAVVALAGIAFWLRNARTQEPLLEPALFHERTFVWSNATLLAFYTSFAAALLVNVLWLESVWGYSALRTGLALAPGPLLVPLFNIVARRLLAHVSPAVVSTFGCLLLAAGSGITLVSVGHDPAYVTQVLPGWLLIGAAVGLTFPTVLGTATASLPPHRTATGSAVVNMSRQMGTVLGISLLVALLGTPHGFPATLSAFRNAWWLCAGTGILAAIAALGISTRQARVRTEVRPIPKRTPPSSHVEAAK
jgi:EmrB/QacA subfamily drug resistance transporter